MTKWTLSLLGLVAVALAQAQITFDGTTVIGTAGNVTAAVTATSGTFTAKGVQELVWNPALNPGADRSISYTVDGNLVNPQLSDIGGTIHWAMTIQPDGGARVHQTGVFGVPLSALVCNGSTDVSITATWQTVEVADSQLTCGPAISPIVDQMRPPAAFYGTTSHKLTVTGNGLAANQAYLCTATSHTLSGATLTGTCSATTTAPMVVPAISFGGSTPWVRLYDTPGPGQGPWYHSDTRWYSWSASGNLVSVGNDFGSVGNCCSNAVGISVWTPDGLTPTVRGNPSGTNSTGQSPETLPGDATNKPATFPADGQRNYTEGIACVGPSCYQYLLRAPGVGGMSIMKSNDDFVTTIGPQDNTGPGAIGKPFVAGVYDYPSRIQDETDPAQSLFVYEQGVCQANVTNCTHNHGTDGYLYFTYPNSDFVHFGSGRVRVEDIRLTDSKTGLSKYQAYAGTAPYAGLNDSSWVPWAIGAGRQWLVGKFGMKCHAQFLAGPNHWLGLCWVPAAADINDSTGINVWDLGDDPQGWDSAILLTKIGPGTAAVHPVFPEFNLASIKAITGGWTVQLSVTGYYGQSFPTPANDGYQPWYSTVTILSIPTLGTLVNGRCVPGGTGFHPSFTGPPTDFQLGPFAVMISNESQANCVLTIQ